MHNYFTYIIVFLFSINVGNAQIDKMCECNTRFMSFSFLNHAVTPLTYKILKKPMHPGFMVGMEFDNIEEDKAFRNGIYSINAGYYYNKFNARAFFIDGRRGLSYRTKFGVYGSFFGGLGYLHSFHPREIFKQNNDGEYKKSTDWGKPGIILLGALTLGYDLSKRTPYNFHIFLKYQHYYQFPYNDEIIALPQALFNIGIKMNIRSEK